MLRFAIYLALLAAAVAYAMKRGGRAEKQVAAILVAMLAIDRAYHAVAGSGEYVGVDAFHAFNDFWALVALFVVALSADRFWPLWVAALQLIALCSHYVRAADVTVLPIVYAVMIRVPSWLTIVILVLGTWNYARRRRGERAG